MKVSLCTISFRHHLISIEDLAPWASAHRFEGIELWSIHAANLRSRPEYGERWLRRFGLHVSMLSDYLPLDGNAEELRRKLDASCALARHWGAMKLRTFAGTTASAATSRTERGAVVARLRAACELVHSHGLRLLVETHPGTLADTAASTARLIAEVAHPALRINFDVLHVWEAGDDPSAVIAELRPHVGHLHLKNVSSRELLDVFAPANVYSASGSRNGMVPLFEGAFDYRTFLARWALDPELEASLEWFGGDVERTLGHDRLELERLTRDAAGEDRPTRGIVQ